MKIEYYGGKLQTVEKKKQGQIKDSRTCLKTTDRSVKEDIYHGSCQPGYGLFGASLGVMRLCAANDKEPYIVIDNYKEAMQAVFKQAKEKRKLQVYFQRKGKDASCR